MKNNSTATTAIWIVLVLVSAVGLGYGIRQIRWSMAINKDLSESKLHVQAADSEPKVETVPEPKPEPEPEVEQIVAEEPVWAEPEEQAEPEVATEPQHQPWRMGRNSSPVQKFFADLNLNEEEQARLREGFELMRRQFESMSAEERWAQVEQMAEMGRRWEAMSDQEREGVTERMRERYEVWRNSDSVEIPQLTLD
jgi:hypothetical protein